MKKFLVVILTFACFTLLSAKDTGIGFILGTVTGLDGKYRISSTNSVDLGIAWDFSNSDKDFTLFSDYIFENSFHINEFPFSYGFGCKIEKRNDDDMELYARLLLEKAFTIEQAQNVECFINVVPSLRVMPDTSFDADAGIGIRFYIN